MPQVIYILTPVELQKLLFEEMHRNDLDEDFDIDYVFFSVKNCVEPRLSISIYLTELLLHICHFTDLQPMNKPLECLKVVMASKKAGPALTMAE